MKSAFTVIAVVFLLVGFIAFVVTGLTLPVLSKLTLATTPGSMLSPFFFLCASIASALIAKACD